MVLALAMLNLPCAAQCTSYSVQIAYGPDCGILGPNDATPYGLNEFGTVVGASGTCGGTGYPFIWSSGPSVQLFTIGPNTVGGAIGINSAGQIIGIEEGPNGHLGFIYQDGKAIELGYLPNTNFEEPYSINDSGVIVGMAAGSTVHAFRWQAGVMTELVLPLRPNATAYDINATGQICGWMGDDPTPPGYSEGFIWDNGAVISLGVPKGAYTTEATALNNHADACGVIRLPNPNGPGFIRHAFWWSNETMTDIGVLPGFVQSLALDINDQGVVVGYCIPVHGAPPPPSDAFFFGTTA